MPRGTLTVIHGASRGSPKCRLREQPITSSQRPIRTISSEQLVLVRKLAVLIFFDLCLLYRILQGGSLKLIGVGRGLPKLGLGE